MTIVIAEELFQQVEERTGRPCTDQDKEGLRTLLEAIFGPPVDISTSS